MPTVTLGSGEVLTTADPACAAVVPARLADDVCRQLDAAGAAWLALEVDGAAVVFADAVFSLSGEEAEEARNVEQLPRLWEQAERVLRAGGARARSSMSWVVRSTDPARPTRENDYTVRGRGDGEDEHGGG